MNKLGILFTSFCLLPCLVSCQKEKLEPINPGKGIFELFTPQVRQSLTV